jgi:hypothetical protein
MTTRTTAFTTSVLALALLAPTAAQAQGFGFSGGFSIAELTGDDVADNLESRTGFQLGAFADLPLGGILALVPGLYYIQKGAESPVGAIDEIAIDYLEIPLLLRVDVSPERTLGVNAYLGPTFAFQVKCEGVADNFSVSCEDDAVSDFDLSKSFDFGAAFGAGLTYRVSPGVSLLTHALWDFGLLSIDESAADRSVKNETILLSVGAVFRP